MKPAGTVIAGNRVCPQRRVAVHLAAPPPIKSLISFDAEHRMKRRTDQEADPRCAGAGPPGCTAPGVDGPFLDACASNRVFGHNEVRRRAPRNVASSWIRRENWQFGTQNTAACVILSCYPGEN